MAPATAQEIQAAVREFLDGGSTQEINILVYQSENNRKALVASAGVVDKLVELTLRDKLAGEEHHYAFFALYYLVDVGRVAQDAIAHAHDGAIFAWLAGPQDHGRADLKNTFISNFTKDHPTNTIRLEAAIEGAASPAGLVLKHLQSGDIAAAALVIKMLIDTSQEKGAKSTIPDSSIAALAKISEWDPSNTQLQLRTVRDQAVFLLLQRLHVEETRQALLKSPPSVVDIFEELTSETSDTRTKLLAVLRLSIEANKDGSIALKIASGGGIPALVAAASSVDDGGILTKDLQTHAANLLTQLAQHATSISGQKQQRSALCALLQRCESESQPPVAVALNVFRGFVGDENDAKTASGLSGIPLMHELLRFVKTYCPTHEPAVVRTLTSILFGADTTTNEINQRTFLRCDGAVKFLVKLLHLASVDSGDELNELTEKLGWVILDLIPRLRSGQTDEIDNTATVLEALEVLSRAPTNRRLFRQHKGVKLLVELLNVASGPHDKLHAARILANVACRDDEMGRLVVEQHAMKPLARMLTSRDAKHQTAALMALRNLASNDTNRTEIVIFGLVPRVIALASKGKATKQRVLAAAVLGNLARLPTNQKILLDHAGDDALLGVLQKATTAPQIETVAAALWVLAKHESSISRLRGKSGAAIVKKTIEPHQPLHVPWATRLLRRLK